MVLSFLLPGNEVQRKWKNIRDNFRNEVRLQKKLASGQGAVKRRKFICCDQFFLQTMQERGTSGNVSPTPSVNESEAQDVTSGHHVGEGLHAKDATYRQQKKRCRATHEESFIELEIILVKTNLFNVSGTVI